MREPEKRMGGQDDLDRMLDAALASYGEPGPASNLPEQVLARIADAVERGSETQRSHRGRQRWLFYAFAVPATATVLLLSLFIGNRLTSSTQTGQKPEPAEAVQRQNRPNQTAGTENTTRTMTGPMYVRGEHRRHSAPAPVAASNTAGGTTALPKLEVFPTPQPLTVQEQALATYARSTPRAGIKALVKAQESEEQQFLLAVASHSNPAPPVEGRD